MEKNIVSASNSSKFLETSLNNIYTVQEVEPSPLELDDDDALFARYCNPNISVKEQDDEDEMHEESKEASPDMATK